MARGTETIFNELLAAKQRETSGLDVLTSNSTTAIWRLMLYVVAYGTHVLETLWDKYSEDVGVRIDQMIPHRPKWYHDKVLAFMYDKTLIPDTDRYDTAGMDEEEIAAAKVVKHAVADETTTASLLIIKVAGEENGVRKPISKEAETQLDAYIQEIKDAGVRYSLVNQQADLFFCELDIYYDPMKLPSTVEDDCRRAVKQYVENLPFNGEYTNMALVDAVQRVDGVKIVELLSSQSAPGTTGTSTDINARIIPEAGYFVADSVVINMKVYQA